MSDVTGKSGVGKRVLDEHGNWRSVTSLPKEVQNEIKAGQKVAQDQFKEKALRHNKEYQDHKAKENEKNLKDETAALRGIVKDQGEIIAKINAKLELGAIIPKEPKTEDENTPDPVVTEAPKPLTPKQKIQAQARELDIVFAEKDTIKDLEAMIQEAEGQNAIDGL